jgi:hypothetical protein
MFFMAHTEGEFISRVVKQHRLPSLLASVSHRLYGSLSRRLNASSFLAPRYPRNSGPERRPFGKRRPN